MTNPQHIRDTMALYLEKVDAGDVDAIVALFAPDAVVEDPVGAAPHQGAQAIDRFYRQGLGAMNVNATLTGPVRVTGNGCGAMPFRIDIMGGASPGSIEVIDVMEFNDDGLICSMKAYWGELNFTPAAAT